MYILIHTAIVTLVTLVRFNIFISMVLPQMLTKLSNTTKVYLHTFRTLGTFYKGSLVPICNTAPSNIQHRAIADVL